MKQNYKSVKMALLFMLLPFFVFAQNEITGTVQDDNGVPIPFANVIEQGTRNGVTTDFDGKFIISVDNLPATLEFSSLGFTTVSQQITDTSPVLIVLSESLESLDEVIVTGLATSIKRSNSANAVASISAEQISGTTPAPTLDGALYGKFAGAIVNSNSGAPGGGLSVKLRGATSITGNTQPLYIIDGVYVSNASIPAGLNAVSGAAAGGSASNQDNPTNRIADLNPYDIENIEILKGASAAAIYGSRAAAGVVVITTKRGKAGETKYNFSQSIGATSILNSLGQRTYTEQRVEDSFGVAAVADFTAARDAGRLVDYEDEIYGENGFISNTNFSASGGTENTRMYAGISHNNEEGIVARTGYEKTSLRLNIDHKATDYFKISFSTNYINSISNRGFFNNDNTGTTIGVSLTGVTPYFDLFPDANGVYPDNPNGSSNPLQTRDRATNKETVNRFIAGTTINLDIYKAEKSNLELVARGGIDYFGQQSRAIFPKDLQFQRPENGGVNGASIQGNSQYKGYNLAAFLVHNYLPNDTWSFRTQAGLTNEFFRLSTELVVATGLIASETNVDQAANVGIDQTRNFQEDSGFFVQEEINYKDQFIGTLGLRGDKSSLNGDPDEFFYFPKASLAVNFNKFGFWNDDSIWNQFKFRIAYGEAGNLPPVGATFTSYDAFSTGGLLGLSLNGVLGNSDINFERQKELEFGTDVSFFDGKLSFSGTYYIKTIDDLILSAAIEPSTGFTTEVVNAGSLRNNGVELAVNATPFSNENFRWDTGINFFKNTSEVTELGVDPFNIGAFGATLGTFRIEEGSSATQIVGIGPNPGANGFQLHGDAEPDFQIAFNNSISYKNFDLSFLWQWKQGGDNVNLTALLTDLNGTSHDFDDVDLDPSGQLGNGPYRLSQLGSSAEVFVEDASYLRLREVGLYYNFTPTLLKGILGGRIDGLRLGFSGTNLINIFDYNSYDPEVSNFGGNSIFTGVEVTPFPSSKRFLFHLAVDF
ncbi:SusC/RagA family TonB-linked outer membrane protein [Dokdonia sp.]|uniref:SusC/RagA family TonB-linked outer membrane protein n=1 Tax=Dokdonia sp. TaxID=2024995 RepID=UPI003264A094